jgi:hypothetical protein
MKKTYGQNWPVYNTAQINEKADFQRLLKDLCTGVAEPEQIRGRPRLPIGDMLFCMTLKVYTTMSGRRFMTDLRAAYEQGLISKLPCYNSVFNYFGFEILRRYLTQLIHESSLPLASAETNFAVDSTGFATSRLGLWNDTRYGRSLTTNKREWIKAHLMCGVLTNIVTAVEVTKGNAGDSPYFKKLLEDTARSFVINEVYADKAYSSLENLKLVANQGGIPFIPFRVNAKAVHSTRDMLWTRLYHFYSYNQEWFKAHYHKRSNSESTNLMIKAKFGERIRSKTEVAQFNELLCKVLCHNVCVTIQSMYEFGIKPDFWKDIKEDAA